MDQLRALNDAKLHEFVNRLQRHELDFADRLANRLDVVRDPSYPMGDHAYRGMSYTLDRLRRQRTDAQRELSRRASMTSVSMPEDCMIGSADGIERALERLTRRWL